MIGCLSLARDTFDIEFEMDDIINFSSYNKGMEILKKYGIEVN